LDFGFVFVEETPAVRTTGAGGAFIVYLCGSLAALRCFALCEGGQLCYCSASTTWSLVLSDGQEYNIK
jgi:hypothetical protein